MMVFVFSAGYQPTADDLNAIFDQICIRKAAAESVTSSTVLQDDNDFSITLDPGTYLVWLWLHVAGDEAGDIKVAWSNSGTMGISRSSIGPAIAMTDRESTLMVMRGNTSTTAQEYGVDGTGSTVIKEELLIEVTVTGVLTLQWAQRASSATATQLSTASRMWVVNVA